MYSPLPKNNEDAAGKGKSVKALPCFHGHWQVMTVTVHGQESDLRGCSHVPLHIWKEGFSRCNCQGLV
ncbi:MAG: hypothetical protein ACQESR_28480, partial [Planctomycetota bacterium]